MSVILNIDSAVEIASVCISRNGEILYQLKNEDRKDHASWLHPAIKKAILACDLKVSDLDAVAVTIGPGSYTGLRIGLSAAKGLCYALNIPLISINTLLVMANAEKKTEGVLLCPMIDARRSEVFAAVYDKNLKEVISPSSLIIQSELFAEILASTTIVFSGNGSLKLKPVIHHPNAMFSDVVMTAADMTSLSKSYFEKKHFTDIAYSEPLYLKEFYSPAH